MTVRLELDPTQFSQLENPLASMGGLSVRSFRYSSGVEALRITNDRGEIVVLPFKGQQIWSAKFDGRDLTMGSMFDAPVDTQNYLETYGAFFIHCGMTAIGAAGRQDDHPLHGEIPNAKFQSAALEFDKDAGTVSVISRYQYIKAFSYKYQAEARITLATNASLIDISLRVTNLKKTPMDLFYLGHANFRPVDNGELIYSASYDREHVRVRKSIPSHISPLPGYREFIEELDQNPKKHHILRPDLAFDPEVVFTLSMTADADGYAHAMQKHPNGEADYIRFRPDQCPMATRWICRTADQQGLGMAFPSTSEVEGYTAEKSKGQYVDLAGGDSWSVDIRLGKLDAVEASKMARHIDQTVGRL